MVHLPSPLLPRSPQCVTLLAFGVMVGMVFWQVRRALHTSHFHHRFPSLCLSCLPTRIPAFPASSTESTGIPCLLHGTTGIPCLLHGIFRHSLPPPTPLPLPSRPLSFTTSLVVLLMLPSPPYPPPARPLRSWTRPWTKWTTSSRRSVARPALLHAMSRQCVPLQESPNLSVCHRWCGLATCRRTSTYSPCSTVCKTTRVLCTNP
jgi:hypothetical protein